jgi:glutamate-ammonia-ligase adenylyltransferase
VCLESVAHYFYQQLIRRYAAEGQVDFLLNQFSCPFVILGMGKLGGNEPNYHSDLDVIFLYDSNSGIESYLADGTTGQYFFSELAASIMRFITHSDRYGQLYEIDSRLRPTGKSGALAVSLDGFERYFATDDGQLWERQSLCKARAVFGTAPMKQQVMEVVHRIITSKPWSDEMAQAIRSMRHAMEADCSERNLKRGVGGTVDIEFAIQMLQLKHARDDASVLVPGTLDAITRLTTAGFLAADRAAALTDCYRQLRQVEAQLRLMNTTARHDLPTDRSQLAKLAMLLNHADADAMTESVEQCRQTVRQQFEALFAG